MNDMLSLFSVYAHNAKTGSVEDLEYLIDVFEHEIYNTTKLQNDKQRQILKDSVFIILNTIEKPDDNVIKL